MYLLWPLSMIWFVGMYKLYIVQYRHSCNRISWNDWSVWSLWPTDTTGLQISNMKFFCSVSLKYLSIKYIKFSLWFRDLVESFFTKTETNHKSKHKSLALHWGVRLESTEQYHSQSPEIIEIVNIRSKFKNQNDNRIVSIMPLCNIQWTHFYWNS